MPGDLQDFFASADWQHRYDHDFLVQGKKLSSPRFLTALHLAPLEDGHLLTAQCDGEELEINFWPESQTHWEFDTSCSCDLGPHCTHSAAALLRAARPNTLARLLRGNEIHTPLPPEKQTPPAPPSQPPEVFPPTFHLEVSEEPAGHRVIQLLLQALKSPNRETWFVARPLVKYGPHQFPLSKTDSGSPVQRDKAAEYRAMEELTQLGLTNLSTNPTYRFLLSLARKQESDTTVDGCWFPDPHLSLPSVYWPWFRAKAVQKLTSQNWQVQIASDFGHDLFGFEGPEMEAALQPAPGGWFTLSVGIDLEGERLDLLPILTGLLDGDTLAQLADQEDQDTHLVYLPSGGALQVPVKRLRAILHHLAALTDPKNPSLHPLDAATLIEDGPLPIDAPPELNALQENLASSNKDQSIYQIPPGLKADLRPYQLIGAEWMAFLRKHDLNGILADDMGLGKTIQTLTHILHLRETGHSGPILIVAPTSVVPNWAAEAKKFAPSLRTISLQGTGRRKLYPHIAYTDLVLTSFAILQRDIDKLKEHEFDLIILDEAQHIKNPSAKVSKAACELRGKQRFCLSGTPVENHLGELWSLFRFLIPGLLGSLEKFKKNYQTPIEKDEDEGRAEALRKRLGPLILRRTKDEVATELPPKTILVHPIELNSAQRDLYETVRATMDKQVRAAIALKGLEQSQFAILDALLKLRQVCCHPSLLKLDTEEARNAKTSAKLDYLFELLDTLFEEGRRILLFSQFTSMLKLIEEELSHRKVSYLKLTGASKDRGGLVERFQNENIPIFLISLKAGGTGLNLTAADTVIHFDPWWNPAAENQATDRAYRIGQEKPVFVHKLLCAGTVEDRIHQLQQKKAGLADSMLSAATKVTPDAETLKNLLSPM